MHNALITAGSVIACGLLLLVGGAAFAGSAGNMDPAAPIPSALPEPVESPLTKAEAISRTLSGNAELAAFAHEVKAMEAESRQAGLRINPELSLEMENFAGSGDFSGLDNAESALLLSQRIELGKKRELRRKLGEKNHLSAQKEWAVLKNEVLSRTVERFYAVLSAQERLALAEEQIDLDISILDTVKQRIDSGKSPAVEAVRFKSLLADSRIRRESTLQELAAARTALALSFGDAPPDFASVTGELNTLPVLPQWGQLAQRIKTTPASQSAASGASAAKQALELARAGRIPDLTVSLGIKNFRETGDNAAMAGISIPLPLFNRNQGAVDSARSRLDRAREDERRIRQEVHTLLSAQFHRLEALALEAATLRDEILPAEMSAFDAVSYGYRSGKFGYLEVLTAQQSLFGAKSRYIDVLTAYHQLYARMENVLGQYDPKGKKS